ncbi:hypothetical protein [Streptomyces synnematoformans]|uniref:Uncharacterized protein n=1 Tax=Streptomyces synnematoformans TaxID=415721 RepID=A0ABP5J9H6_9ACTN
MATLRVGSGKTAPGESWQLYGQEGVYIDVDTSAANFSGNPVYHASIYSTGGNQLWTHGAHGIYNVTATGFRLYLRWVDDAKRGGKQLTPDTCREFGFHVAWSGIDEP